MCINAGCGGCGGGWNGMPNEAGVTGPPNDDTEAAGDENAGVGGVGIVIGGRMFAL